MAGRGHKFDGFVARSPYDLPKNNPENLRQAGFTPLLDGEAIETQIARWVKRCKQPRAYLSAAITFEDACALSLAYFNEYGHDLVTRHDSNTARAEWFGNVATIRTDRRAGTLEDFDVWADGGLP